MFCYLKTQQQTGTHIVNYVHARDFDGTEHTFATIESFCEFVFSGEHQGYTFIAHNAKSFDAQFLLKYCMDNAIKPFCIYNGTKIMYMSVKDLGLRFIDSINFVADALETFPKTFGLSELKKGYFPYYFITPENQNYTGPMPAMHYYDPNHMKPDKRSKFLKWYAEHVAENYVFDFQKELRAYCRWDVYILRRGEVTLRGDFLKIANIDPLQYITVASVCMAVYSSKFMPKKASVIKNTPENTFSKASIQWMHWMSETQNEHIQHAMNGGEKFISTVGMVDGYCEKTNMIYEFQGFSGTGARAVTLQIESILYSNAIRMNCNERPN